MDTELAKKAVGAIEELMQSEIGSGRPDRFANVQQLALHAQVIDRMAVPLRVSEFEVGKMADGGGVNVLGGMNVMNNRIAGNYPGDLGDNQRQMIMAMLPGLGEVRGALTDMREKDRAIKRANLSSETLDLMKLRNDLPEDSGHRVDLVALIEANLAALAALPPLANGAPAVQAVPVLADAPSLAAMIQPVVDAVRAVAGQ